MAGNDSLHAEGRSCADGESLRRTDRRIANQASKLHWPPQGLILRRNAVESDSLNDVVLRSLEHERTGIEVYRTALRCAVTSELRDEWDQNLARTERNERMLTEVCDVMDIDPDEETPDRRIVRQVGSFLVNTMQEALDNATAETAELIACECVVLAEARRYENAMPAPAAAHPQAARRVRFARPEGCAAQRPQRA